MSVEECKLTIPRASMGLGGLFVIFALFISCSIGGNPQKDVSNGIPVQLGVKESIFNIKLVIGTAKKPYHLILGTSFSGIWLFSKEACEKNKMFKKVQKYDDSRIQNKESLTTFTIHHVEGTVNGYIIKEKVKIDDIELESDVGIVTEWEQSVADNNWDGSYDGYFGIQFISSGTEKSIGQHIWQSLVDKKHIKEQIYGLYLNAGRQEGELFLGGVNNNLIEEGDTLFEVNTLGDGHATGWYVEVKSIKVGEKVIKTNLKATVDPSTNHLGGEETLVDSINTAIGATLSTVAPPLFVFDPCPKCGNLPVITLNIGGKDFILEGDDYHYRNNLGPIVMCASHFYKQDLNGYDLILGTPFLNKYYSKFDIAKKTISFARARQHDD